MTTIGIRREDKHPWEARAPLTPAAVERLVHAEGLTVVVQPSPTRAYSDDAYAAAGAEIREDLSGCTVVLAVKEIPCSELRANGAYVFFSHTIKGQPQNMPLLRRLSELGCTLVDYERIVDEQGRRLVFFGHHAGLAGMIDTLWLLGRRLGALGYDTPFGDLRVAFEYGELAAAETAVRAAGERLSAELAPPDRAPLVVGFAGNGNVSRGAQQVFELLPHEWVEPAALPALIAHVSPTRDRLFGAVFEEQHLVERTDVESNDVESNDGGGFDKLDYFAHPERYRSIFARHLPQLSVLVNGIFWTERYPRLVTRDILRRGLAERLLVIGDISCDIEGSIECTVKATTPGMPAYLYDPVRGSVADGYEGPGIAMMTTDCLPCELPRESTEAFTAALSGFVPALARIDASVAFEEAVLPPPIRRATILWNGVLTPDYQYLTEHL
jgi:alanine dehydrogenase